jgi:hypothetical protein
MRMARISRPSITLGIPGDPFTLFYDYDQVEEHKLTPLTKEQKAIWFEEVTELLDKFKSRFDEVYPN